MDAGNALFKKTTNSLPHPQALITATGILAAYEKMKYDGVAVGPKDLAAGRDFLLSRSPLDFPWLSANLYDNKNNLLFPPYLILDKKGIKVGIIALTGKLSHKTDDFSIAPWQEVLPALVDSVAKKCDILLLLSSLNRKENTTIAEKFSRIDILLSASSRSGNLQPKIINNTILTQTKKQGKYLGILTCTIGQSGKWEVNIEKKRKHLHERLLATGKKFEQTEHNTAIRPKKKKKLLSSLQEQQQTILNQLEELEKQQNQQGETNQTDSTFRQRFIALQKSMPEDKEINTIVKNIKKQIRKRNRARKKDLSQDDKHVQKAIGNMAGSTICKSCHEVQTTFWQNTAHYHSYSTLLSKGQAYNLACLPCHTTHQPESLQDAPKGREILLALPSPFLVVGCESCHGEGLKHSESPETILPGQYPDKNVCISCHTKERDPNFEYTKMVMKVGCPPDE